MWACRRPSTRMLAKGRRRAALGSAALRPFGLAAWAATWHIPHAFVGATFRVAILLFLSQRRGRPMCLPALLGKHAVGRTPNYACH